METPTHPTITIILNILLFNWVPWLKQLKAKCQSQFGQIGMAVLNNTQSTIIPYPQLSDKTMDGKFKYPADEYGELTDRGFTLYNNAIKRYEQQYDLRVKDDDACLTFILQHLHPNSETAARNHPSYTQYSQLPQGARATAMLALLQSLHSGSDAATKNARTIDYFNSKFHDDINTSIELTNQKAIQFLADFGCPDNPGMIVADHIHCFILCQLISEPNFDNFRHSLLLDNTSSALTDPSLLASKIIQYNLINRSTFTTDTTSEQGQGNSFITTPTTISKSSTSHPPKSTPKASTIAHKPTFTIGDISKPHCPHCFKTRQLIFNNHGVPGKPLCLRLQTLPSRPPGLTQPRSFITSPVHPPVNSFIPPVTFSSPQPPQSYPPSDPISAQSFVSQPQSIYPLSHPYYPQPSPQHVSHSAQQFIHNPSHPSLASQTSTARMIDHPIISKALSYINNVTAGPPSNTTVDLLSDLHAACADPENY